ncbi:MAG: hypothetical protein JXR68_10155, partial [Bacteroidales bacterium]|nr:hypothetical protein [Bacteroidales bacterium]
KIRTMKRTKFLLIFFSLFVLTNMYSQQADKFILVDSSKNRGYEIDKGTNIKVKTDSIGYYGSLEDVTDEGIVLNNIHLSWEQINSITFEDKTIFKKWKNVALLTLITNIILTTIGIITDNGDGFIGLIYIIITLPMLFLSISFLLIGLVFSKKGTTIKYKK